MKKPVVFMFSGQGSQYFNMGKEFYLSSHTYRRWMERLDDIFYGIAGKSVVKVLYADNRQKSEVFDDIFYTHPAIFMVEYSIAQVLLEKGIYPDYILGSSLGEFASCAVSGVMSCEDALRCLAEQARLLESRCEKGGMLAIIHDYRLYREEPLLHGNSEMASVNYHSHFVVSGSIEGLAEIENFLKAKGTLFMRLPVRFAFHSSLIDPIEKKYKEFLKAKSFCSPEYVIVSCSLGGTAAASDSRFLWDAVRKPMDFREALKCLNVCGECTYIDLGPSGTLANFTKYNLGGEKKSSIFPLILPFNNGLKNLELLCGSLGVA